jgi:hypothetical protein
MLVALLPLAGATAPTENIKSIMIIATTMHVLGVFLFI